MAVISGIQFVTLLERTQSRDTSRDTAASAQCDDPELKRLRIPTGPWDTVDLDNPMDFDLEVADSVNLRGRKLDRPVFVYGVRFRGQVDLGDLTVQGSVDLTACVFDEELLLDDSEIQGSLRLARISSAYLSMIGIVVRGSLDLHGCQSDEAVRLLDATVDGFVDLRGMTSPAVNMKGAWVRSDLHIGCATDAGSNPSPSQLELVDASHARIEGRVTVDGAGHGQTLQSGIRPRSTAAQSEDDFLWSAAATKSVVGLRLILALTKVGGSLQMMAFYGQTTYYDSVREQHAPSVKASMPIVWSILERLDLSGADIAGDVTLWGTLVQGGIDAAGVHVGGRLRLIPGQILVGGGNEKDYWCCRRTVVRSDIKMAASQIDGSVSVVGVSVRGELDFSSSNLGSFMWVSGYKLLTESDAGYDVVVPTEINGSLDLYLATLKSAVELQGVQIEGSLNLWSIESRAYVRLEPYHNRPCRVNDEIDLHSARLLEFELKGTRVGGYIRLDGCDMLRFSARPGVLRLPSRRDSVFHDAEPTSKWTTEDAIVFSEAGHLLMRNGKIGGDLGLEYLQLTGREVAGRRGLVIEDSEIGGNLLMFGEAAILGVYRPLNEPYAKLRARCSIDFHDFSATVIGGISLKRTKVWAAVDMSGVKVDGTIELEDSCIGGDLRFEAVMRSGYADGLASGTAGVDPWSRDWNPAVCQKINLRMAKCTNDVDLTGVVVVRAKGREAETGLIDGRYAAVDGDLTCFDKKQFKLDEKEVKLPVYARLEGDLDLSYARLVHVVVSGCMFGSTQPDPSESGPKHRLELERATVGKLEVRAANGCDADAAFPICLTDVKVEVWQVNEGAAARDKAKENEYINLLANDEPFRRSTYRSLENFLRNSGDDEHADTLYRAMRRRDLKETRQHAWHQVIEDGARLRPLCFHHLKQLFGFMKDRAFHIFLKHGTSPMTLFGVVVALFLVSLPAYRIAENFEASLSFLAVPTDHFKVGELAPKYNQPPSRWEGADAIQFALKNHVPIVPLRVREDWQPRDEGPTTWSMDGGSCSKPAEKTVLTGCLPWAPEDVFNLLQLINWICWPILLTFYIRQLLRQS
jgi:hypothetical protein